MLKTIHLQLLLATFAGWVSREQSRVIAHLVEENRILREQLAIAEYAEHYHEERSHQGIGNALIRGVAPQSKEIVEIRERLGGLLKYYYRRAA